VLFSKSNWIWLKKNIFRKFIFVIFISYLERPSNIMINMTSSSSIAIAWSLPVTSSDSIQETEVQLYNGNNHLVYNRVVYHLDTSLIIITSRPMTSCDLYTVQLRCKYYKVGWSQYQEEKFWGTGMLCLILSCSWSIWAVNMPVSVYMFALCSHRDRSSSSMTSQYVGTVFFTNDNKSSQWCCGLFHINIYKLNNNRFGYKGIGKTWK